MKVHFRLFLVVALCFSMSAWADTEVNVEVAGTLSSILSASDSKLKVTGVINGTDAKYLRQLVTSGGVTSLDLSGVEIVGGGEAYYESFKTENDVLGDCMFKECTKLTNIVLPSSITAIGGQAFSGSGLREVDIPNSVTRLGGDAFAYCSELSKVVVGSRVSSLGQGVFYSSSVSKAYVKPETPPATPAYLFSSNPIIYVYSESLTDYKQSGWKQFGSIVGGLEEIYPKEADSSDVVNSLSGTWFEDIACTRLKSTYQAMSDEALTALMTEGGMPSFMVSIALKLKHGDWANYEQDFRIHNYKAYSDANYWNDKMMSSGGSYMGNPTGIYSDGSPLYVFVDSDVPEDATLYIAGCVDNYIIGEAKTGKKLKKGLNIVDGQAKALYYIIYTADTKSQTKTLDQWPTLKIHIEGGIVNGYYDVARHSDQDYQALLNAATHERFTIKGTEALFNFKTSSYKKVWPKTIDRSISWFDSLTVWEKELMGMCVSVASGSKARAPFYLTGGEAIFPIYYNNPNFAIEGEESDAGYANSTPHRTSYNSLDCIRNSFDVSRFEMDDWCSAHECGHNNQRAINLEGGTEVSNNLFSNYIRHLDGLAMSNGSPLSTVMQEYAAHIPFFIRPVDSQLRMYWQLYLYYHLAQKNTAFYPSLFKALRDDPLTLWSNSYNSSLKFVRKVCEVAQEDLTDFFTAWGFFEPMTNVSIDDYGMHTMTVRKADIDRTKNAISKYPRKNNTILFIEDRVEELLTTDMLTTAGQKRRDSDRVGTCGDLGQFTDYLPNACEPGNYTYLKADSLYALDGTGGLGFIMLDENEKMCYAANALKFCIPSSVKEGFTIYSVNADGSLNEVAMAGEGTQTIALEKSGELPDSLSDYVVKAVISGTINGTDIKHLRHLINERNLASVNLYDAKVVSGGEAYYENYRTSGNIMGNYAFYQCKKLVAMRLPESIVKIGTNAFANTGLKEIVIPESVISVGGDAFAYCDQLTRVTVGSKVRTMEKGVFYNSKVTDAYVKPMTPPTISSYLFSSNPVIHVYASALAAYQASPWAEFGTLVGDLDGYTDGIEDIEIMRDGENETMRGGQSSMFNGQWYDLSGRRISNSSADVKKGIYIKNGRKFVITQ